MNVDPYGYPEREGHADRWLERWRENQIRVDTFLGGADENIEAVLWTSIYPQRVLRERSVHEFDHEDGEIVPRRRVTDPRPVGELLGVPVGPLVVQRHDQNRWTATQEGVRGVLEMRWRPGNPIELRLSPRHFGTGAPPPTFFGLLDALDTRIASGTPKAPSVGPFFATREDQLLSLRLARSPELGARPPMPDPEATGRGLDRLYWMPLLGDEEGGLLVANGAADDAFVIRACFRDAFAAHVDSVGLPKQDTTSRDGVVTQEFQRGRFFLTTSGVEVLDYQAVARAAFVARLTEVTDEGVKAYSAGDLELRDDVPGAAEMPLLLSAQRPGLRPAFDAHLSATPRDNRRAGVAVYHPDKKRVFIMQQDFFSAWEANKEKLGMPISEELLDGENAVMMRFESGTLSGELGARELTVAVGDPREPRPAPQLTGREVYDALMVAGGDRTPSQPLSMADLRWVAQDGTQDPAARRAARALIAHPEVFRAWSNRVYAKDDRLSEYDLRFVWNDLHAAGRLDQPIGV